MSESSCVASMRNEGEEEIETINETEDDRDKRKKTLTRESSEKRRDMEEKHKKVKGFNFVQKKKRVSIMEFFHNLDFSLFSPFMMFTMFLAMLQSRSW
jgi:hypothetical protein